jgi:acetyl-CoA/propionyl-CoA carboxylase biotin carboxyl carrier protein
VDSSLRADTVVGSDYDPMLSKVIAHADDRAQALARLDQALSQTAVLGVQTNIEFLRFLLADQRVQAGDLDTALLDERLGDFEPLAAPDDVFAAAGLYVQWALQRRSRGDLWASPSGWRVGGAAAAVRTAMRTAQRSETVAVRGLPDAAEVTVGDGETLSASAQVEAGRLSVTLGGARRDYRWAEVDRHLWIADERGTWHIREAEEHRIHRAAGERPAEVVSPMPGSVIAVQADSGAEVSEGDVVVVVEAMKMEHSLTAPVSGQVEVLVSVGDQVTVDQVLARLVPATEEATESKD